MTPSRIASPTLAYRYRIKDRSAKKALRRYAFGVNQAWNWCVAYQRDIENRYRAGAPKRRWPSHFDLTYPMAGVGADLGIAAATVSEVCREFVKSRDAARHAPAFRASGGARRALGWVPFRSDCRRVDGDKVTYRKRAYRFWVGGRPVPTNAKGGCFVEDARGRWYVCFYAEVAPSETAATGEVGIDLGLKALATCSDGLVIDRERIVARYAQQLAIAQRAGNKRRAQAIHAKIGNVRKDFLHKATTALVRENRLIVVGDVSSAKLAKTKMAKSVLDAGWAMFKNQLRYKASRHGVEFLVVDERNTSRCCSACGVIPTSSPKGRGDLGIRRWRCSECGALHDRDVNAALNILAVGKGALPRADDNRGESR